MPRSLVIALCAGYFLVLLDVTVVNVALPRIGADLHPGSGGLSWVVDGYAVPLAALLLVSGTIGDRIGHRSVVLTGLAGFGLASALCALAPVAGVLIAARAVQGTSAALMLPGTLALLTERVADGRERARIVGLWAAVGGAALPAGPVVGGLLVEVAGWRSVFWLSLPVVALALLPVLRLPAGPAVSGSGPLPRGSAPAAALLVVALGTAVAAIVEVRRLPAVAGVLAGAALASGLMLRRIERTARSPLLPVPGPARRPLAAACAVAGLMNLGTLGTLFLLTQLLQDVRGLGPLRAGLVTLPAVLPLPLLGAPGGRLSARVGAWRTAALGLLLAAAGLVGLAVAVPETGWPLLLCALAVWGVGLGLLTPAIVAAALQAVPELPGLAAGASNTARQAGGALGVALFGAVAGGASAAGFVTRAGWLVAGAGVVFALTAASVGWRPSSG